MRPLRGIDLGHELQPTGQREAHRTARLPVAFDRPAIRDAGALLHEREGQREPRRLEHHRGMGGARHLLAVAIAVPAVDHPHLRRRPRGRRSRRAGCRGAGRAVAIRPSAGCIRDVTVPSVFTTRAAPARRARRRRPTTLSSSGARDASARPLRG